ncbi:MAG: RDD family protein [Actinomycetota bacterium]|nr:RDD family protein [Actinomycetota bacterium]
MTGAHRADLEFATIGDLGDIPLATLGGRLFARLIDAIAIGVPAVLAAFLIMPEQDDAAVVLVKVLAVLLLWLLYDTILVAGRGTTPGKKIMGIDVVHAVTGTPPTFRQAFVRALVYLVTPVVTPVAALFTERRRGFHDWAASTVLVLSRR